MSHFKRKQSQVFWKYMESHDLGLPRSATDIRNNDEESKPSRPTEFPRLMIAEEEEERDEIPAEVTPELPAPWAETEARERSASPRSYVGHRSQDSGFSDSERSEESGVDAYASRVERLRRARTRKSRRKKILAEEEEFERLSPERDDHRYGSGRSLESFWAATERSPHPRHTSTPKTSLPRGRKLSASQPRGSRRRGREFTAEKERRSSITSLNRDKDAEDDDEDNESDSRVPRMILQASMDDGECLGDFLYASEPPEDARQADAVSPFGLPRRTTTNQSLGRNNEINGQLAPVKFWLNLIAIETETECGATLQSKALPRASEQHRRYNNGSENLCYFEGQDSTLLTASATAAATKLLARVEKFNQCYQSAVDELSKPVSERSERGLVQSVEEEAFLLLSDLGSPPPQRVRNLSSPKEVFRQLSELRDEVERAVDARLDFFIERVVRGLEEAPREDSTAARGALAAMTVLGLGQGGSRGGRSMARCSGVQALLTALLSIRGKSEASRDSRAACLRALASVCCCAEAIEQLIENGGPEILADLLSSSSAPEIEKMEGAALVVQITAPWTDALGLPHLEPFADELVNSLTLLAEATNCAQTLLLAAAALNNLARSPRCVEPMVERKTVAALLRSVKQSGGGSIWLMEQVAALIGELARSPELHSHLAEARASVALVCFMRMRPPGLESAYRRLEATASAALARLCVHREVAQQVVDVGASNCVIPYQKNVERNENKVGARYTRSLRIACRKAAEQIDAAKASDRVCTLDR